MVIKTDLNEVPTLSLDRDRMNQALKGIVMNSTDAIEDKGEISLSTGVAEDGKHVLVSVSDNGKGANQEDLPNIFEPFYRTKMARISGASLTTAYAIVKEHDGNIDALIRDEGGLIFKIGLPV